jgi:hypothetical protein
MGLHREYPGKTTACVTLTCAVAGWNRGERASQSRIVSARFASGHGHGLRNSIYGSEFSNPDALGW